MKHHMKRRCSRCKRLAEFYPRKKGATPDSTCKECRRKYQREYGRRNAKTIWARNLSNKYAITPERFDALLADQGGKCALFEVCGSTEPGGRGTWHVDHDHITGKVRGLLCHICNRSRVGANTVKSAAAVLAYLKRYT